MTRLEMVEKIKEKTGVTYEEARQTLEKNNWDLLDSIVALERERPLYEYEQPANDDAHQTATEDDTKKSAPKRVVKRSGTGELGDKIAAVLRWVGTLIKKGEENRLEISRKGEDIMSVSITAIILMLLINWWLPILLVILGLFTGYKYRMAGSTIVSRVVNTASEKASEKADAFKDKIDEDET